MINTLLVIQPIDLCNLNCSYCYVPGRRNPKVMSDEVLEATARVIFNSSVTIPDDSEDLVKISWHASEPMLAGMDFYEKALEVFTKYQGKSRFRFNIQTNATVVNQEWCDFFNAHNFEIGLSVDGPEFIHNRYRKDWKGKGSFSRVMKGIDCLRENNIPLHGLVVITDYSLDYPDEVYAFFKDNNFKHVGFNLEELEAFNQKSSMVNLSHAENIRHSQLAARFSHFFSRLYDLWEKDGYLFHIREFEEVIDKIKYIKTTEFNDHPLRSSLVAFSNITITKDGNVSTFAPEMAGGTAEDPNKFVIGNVLNIESFDDLEKNENYQRLRDAIFKGIRNCASECSYFDLCGGGCPSNKFYENGKLDSTETMMCIFMRQILTDIVIEKLSRCSVESVQA